MENPGSRHPKWAANLGTISSLWLRDVLHLVREKARWFGVVLQPLLFWALLGGGMSSMLTSLTSAAEESPIDYSRFFFPGILAMIILFTSIFATMSIIEDRRNGFLQAALVSPSSRSAIVLGKISGVVTMTLVQTAFFLLFAPLAGIDLGGIRWGHLVIVVMLSSAMLTAFSMAMAWIIDSVQGYHAIMSVVLLPLWIVSGAMFPVKEPWFVALSRINPLYYVVGELRKALDPSTGVHQGSLLTIAIFGLIGAIIATRVIARNTHVTS